MDEKTGKKTRGRRPAMKKLRFCFRQDQLQMAENSGPTWRPSKHEALIQLWLNVGPAPKADIGAMSAISVFVYLCHDFLMIFSDG